MHRGSSTRLQANLSTELFLQDEKDRCVRWLYSWQALIDIVQWLERNKGATNMNATMLPPRSGSSLVPPPGFVRGILVWLPPHQHSVVNFSLVVINFFTMERSKQTPTSMALSPLLVRQPAQTPLLFDNGKSGHLCRATAYYALETDPDRSTKCIYVRACLILRGVSNPSAKQDRKGGKGIEDT